MREPNRVLLVHSDPEWLVALRRALGDGLAAVTTASPDEALSRLDERGIELVVAEEKVGVGFLEELTRRAPRTPRAILLNGGDRRPWIEAAAEGHVFVALPERAPDLGARLRALVTARLDTPTGLAGCSVEVAADTGAVASGPLLRLTSDTLVFRLEPGDALEAFLPGRELAQLSVRRGRERVLEGCAAVVQGLRPDSGGGYEVELALFAPPSPASREPIVRDPLQRASLVAEALRRGRLVMERTDGRRARAVVRGRVDALTELLVLEETPEPFEAGAAVRFSFEAGGAHYEFFGALGEAPVQSDRPVIAAALPQELRGRRRRRARVPLAEGEATAALTPFLAGAPVRRPVVDVEMEGMGFLAEPEDLLPIGTRLFGIGVTFAQGAPLTASGRIVSRAVAAGSGGARVVRCGVQFDPLSADAVSALAGAMLHRTHPGLELARGLSFDELWAFLRESGFVYPEKEEKLRPVLPEITRTLSALLANPDGPLRTLLFRAGGQLQGHVSTLRAYRRTWMVQHLAAGKDGPGKLDAARALNVGVVEYLEQLPDCEWIRVWFRPNNRWPARTFGRFARLQYDPHRCDIRTYAYLCAPAGGAPLDPEPGLEVTDATAADWSEIRRHLVAAGHTASLAAEDLCSAPDLSEADAPYALLGLARRREALVARRGGRLVGFALLELAPVGLNFSELTNAFRLHAVEPDGAATAALAAGARARYAALGRPLAIGLAERPDLAAWAAAGFEKAKEYSCWTVHRSFLRRYVEFIQRLYEYLPARAVRGHA